MLRNAVLMLVQRRRRCANIKTALDECLCKKECLCLMPCLCRRRWINIEATLALRLKFEVRLIIVHIYTDLYLCSLVVHHTLCNLYLYIAGELITVLLALFPSIAVLN